MPKCGIVNTLSSRDRSITAVDTATQQTDTSLLAYLLCPAAATTTAALLMRRSQRLRGARRHAGRRCQGCKDAHCVRPVLTHWGCERARPGQHSANALRRLGAEVVRRAADDAGHQDLVLAFRHPRLHFTHPPSLYNNIYLLKATINRGHGTRFVFVCVLSLRRNTR
eukprot:COSAG01_NODE_449_length_16915_cov_23.001903_3_plen_167_part_00